MSYNRYTPFINGDEIGVVPFCEISISNSDMYEVYKRGKTRLDKVSYNYYGSSDYAWLILQSNPQYGSMEFSIPDGVELRIPYPLNNALERYHKSITDYKKKYN